MLFIHRVWAGHRVLAIAGASIGLVAVLAAGAVFGPFKGGAASASASPATSSTPALSAIPTASMVPSPTADLDPTPLPSGMAYADLDGVAAPTDLAHRLPLAIMIDDVAAARPQSGISSASIVYQAPADGDADRYMMVFQEGTASDIGPVRSARPYYVYWANEYKALYGHFGGDADALQIVIPANSQNIYNMDGISTGQCPYHRITTRVSPQNAYTSTAALIGCLAAKHYPATFQNLPTRQFQGDLALADRPDSQVISIAYPNVKVGYRYIPGSDSYLRLIDGAPEIDPANKQQVLARSIVVMYQTLGIDPKSEYDKVRPLVVNIGTGKALVFQEGHETTATWKKASATDLTRFYDASGTEIQLVRGEIFIQSLPTKYVVTVA